MKNHSLYYSKYCYFCQKVMMSLRGKKHDIELRSTSKKEHATALLKGGGKTQVPCLRIDEGKSVQWLYESNDIITYINTHKLAEKE